MGLRASLLQQHKQPDGGGTEMKLLYQEGLYIIQTKMSLWLWYRNTTLDIKVHVANMGPTWVLSASGDPNIGPMDLGIMDWLCQIIFTMWLLSQNIWSTVYFYTN